MKYTKLNLLIIAVTAFCCIAAAKKDFEPLKYNNPGLVDDLGVGLWAWPLPMDYDNDGDYDLIVSCSDKPYNGIYFFENTGGNLKMPVFKEAVRIANGVTNIQVSYIDGKPRVLTPRKELEIFSDKPFTEAKQIYPDSEFPKLLGRIRANQWKYCDYDGDGNLDLIVGIGHWGDYGWDNAYDENGVWKNGPLNGYVFLIRNSGTTQEPQYEEPVKIEAGGKPINVYGMPSPNFADMDNDGDLDIICGEFVDKFTYFENIGTRTAPVYKEGRFLEYNGKPITMDLEMIIPVAIDWDKDGDIDLIVGQEDGRVAFMENIGILKDSMPQFQPPRFFSQIADRVKFGALATPCAYDWDNDGDQDIIAGNSAGYIGFIENLGGCPPKFAKPVYLEANGEVIHIQAGENGSIQGPCESKWGYTVLTVADWDCDGLPDIIINSIWGKIQWYKNIGTLESPRLAKPAPIEVDWQGEAKYPAWNWWKPKGNELVTQWRTTPFVIDLNKDNLMDIVMLDHEGYLAYFERQLKNYKLILLPGKRIFKNADEKDAPLLRLNDQIAGKSGRRKICLIDWNGDGRLDIIANSKNMNLLENVKEQDGFYHFSDKGLMAERILAGHTTCPTIVDWNKNNIPDLLVGAEDGFFYYLEQ